MKLKIWSKLLLWLGCLLTLLMGAALIAAAVSNAVVYQVQSVLNYEITNGKWVDLVLLVCGAVLVLFALFAMSIPGKLRYKKRNFVVQDTESGDLRISVKAIEGLVKRCVDMHDEISMSNMRIISRKTGVVVELRVSLNGNISIPLAIASLQKQIKQYLLASSGIEVNHVSVTVDTTRMDAVKKCTPAAAPAEEETAQPAEEKKPVHQRLFASRQENEAAEKAPKKAAEAAEEKKQQEAPAENVKEDAAPEAEKALQEEAPAQEASETNAEEKADE
ncbi:MAG: alkaline shock response membrane anchor protein AmaP [Clostridia bacterium]|nr:alkaline shock response membrane anchor protein AmaP [Clostridia bacterium]